jgi:hypothetical protein
VPIASARQPRARTRRRATTMPMLSATSRQP